MKLQLKFDRIDCGDIAVKMLPAVCSSAKPDSSAWQLTLDAVSRLPERLIRELFEAIPTEEKNAIIAAFAAEYETEILKTLNDLLVHHQIGIRLSAFRLRSDLTLTAQIENMDYPVLVGRFLPTVKRLLLSRGGMIAKMRPLIEAASAEQLCGLLERFTGGRTDELLAALIQQNQQALIARVENMAERQNIHLKLTALELIV